MTAFYFSWNLLSLEIYRSTLFKDCVGCMAYETYIAWNLLLSKMPSCKLFHRIAIDGPIRGFLYIYFEHCSLTSNTIFSYVYYYFHAVFARMYAPRPLLNDSRCLIFRYSSFIQKINDLFTFLLIVSFFIKMKADDSFVRCICFAFFPLFLYF